MGLRRKPAGGQQRKLPPCVSAIKTAPADSRRFGRLVLRPQSIRAHALFRKEKGRRWDRRPLHFHGGDDGIRTHDPHVANVMLSQLSYIPTYGALLREVLFCRLHRRLSNPHSANAHNARADMPPNGKSIGRRAPLPCPRLEATFDTGKSVKRAHVRF